MKPRKASRETSLPLAGGTAGGGTIADSDEEGYSDTAAIVVKVYHGTDRYGQVKLRLAQAERNSSCPGVDNRARSVVHARNISAFTEETVVPNASAI